MPEKPIFSSVVGILLAAIDPNDKVFTPLRVDWASPKLNTQVVLVMVPEKSSVPWSLVWAWPMDKHMARAHCAQPLPQP